MINTLANTKCPAILTSLCFSKQIGHSKPGDITGGAGFGTLIGVTKLFEAFARDDTPSSSVTDIGSSFILWFYLKKQEVRFKNDSSLINKLLS